MSIINLVQIDVNRLALLCRVELIPRAVPGAGTVTNVLHHYLTKYVNRVNNDKHNKCVLNICINKQSHITYGLCLYNVLVYAQIFIKCNMISTSGFSSRVGNSIFQSVNLRSFDLRSSIFQSFDTVFRSFNLSIFKKDRT